VRWPALLSSFMLSYKRRQTKGSQRNANVDAYCGRAAR
jgi:hypothetical protein